MEKSYMWTVLIKSKDEAFEVIKKVEAELKLKVRAAGH
jgi:hypothetical protein